MFAKAGPWFGRLVSWELLGRDRLTAIVIGLMAVAGIVVVGIPG